MPEIERKSYNITKRYTKKDGTICEYQSKSYYTPKHRPDEKRTSKGSGRTVAIATHIKNALKTLPKSQHQQVLDYIDTLK